MRRQVGNVEDFVYLLVDSEAYNHVCPPDFAVREPIKENDDLLGQRAVTTVNGLALQQFGVKKVSALYAACWARSTSTSWTWRGR